MTCNYYDQPSITNLFGLLNVIQVYVELKENEDICSMASFQNKYRTTVKIDPKSSYAVPFVIIPLKAGQFDIEVKAFDLASQKTDGVQRTLKVVVSY